MSATPSFNAWRALVLHRRDDGIDRLVRQLDRLGMISAVAWDVAPDALPPYDIVLVDADQGWDGLLPWCAGQCPVPMVALLGSEAPGRIAWALARGAGAVIPKPITATSVYPALVLAAHAHEARVEAQSRIAELEERVRMRPLVHAAVQAIMAAQGLDETTAYGLLRQAAMSRRQSMQSVAAAIVAGHEPMPRAI
jgi:AmiR/NasT family two-component response regulator